VRWDELFADLEAQFDELGVAELEAEIAERTRLELSRIRLVDRLRATIGRTVSVKVRGAAEPVAGRLDRVGSGWLLLTTATGREVVVNLAAITTLAGHVSGRADDPLSGGVSTRLGLAHVLRGIARDRSTVALALADGSQLTGTVDRVGADHLDFAEHEPDTPRREPDVRGLWVIPFVALSTVLRRA
jgi:hypothetical protein